MVLTLFSILFKGVAAGILVSAPLGPIGVIQIQRTMHKGVKAGLISGQGIAIADTLYAIIAGFGVTYLSSFLLTQNTTFNIIGGTILFVMGVRMLIKNSNIKTCNINIYETSPRFHKLADFFSMFIITITNPFTIILYTVVFTLLGLNSSSSAAYTNYLITLGVYLGASIWWFILSSSINKFREKIKLYNIAKINKVFGIVIILCAFYLAYNAIF
jgi:threonine/homoserine/homoserine lactone efflux protein